MGGMVPGRGRGEWEVDHLESRQENLKVFAYAWMFFILVNTAHQAHKPCLIVERVIDTMDTKASSLFINSNAPGAFRYRNRFNQVVSHSQTASYFTFIYTARQTLFLHSVMTINTTTQGLLKQTPGFVWGLDTVLCPHVAVPLLLRMRASFLIKTINGHLSMQIRQDLHRL